MSNARKNNQAPILIYGPTASGKSAAALELARAFDGVIVNADALQVYSSYEVLTARPRGVELAQAPHALYGYVDNSVFDYSVGQWLRDVEKLLATTDKTPIFVGGTGLYFRALTQGLADIPTIPSSIRENIEIYFKNKSLQHAINVLSKHDPAIIPRIDTQNPRRVIRALEVFEATGKPLSQWQDETPAPLIPSATRFVLSPDVEALRTRISQRANIMWQDGAIDEVRALSKPWRSDLPANRAIGAAEIAAFLNGDVSEDEAKAALITATHQYAKRQRSWARSNMRDWQWVTSRDALVAQALGK